MLFEAVEPGERAVDPDAPGLRSKLGGEPDWTQDDDWPACPACRERMTFVAQIDSFEHDSAKNPHRIDCLSGDQHFMFGDVGMVYVFLCFDCLETPSLVQCSYCPTSAHRAARHERRCSMRAVVRQPLMRTPLGTRRELLQRVTWESTKLSSSEL